MMLKNDLKQATVSSRALSRTSHRGALEYVRAETIGAECAQRDPLGEVSCDPGTNQNRPKQKKPVPAIPLRPTVAAQRARSRRVNPTSRCQAGSPHHCKSRPDTGNHRAERRGFVVEQHPGRNSHVHSHNYML